MANSGDIDKFSSLIIPNCQRTSSQQKKLQSCPFARESEVLPSNIHPSSSSDASSEQDTGIAILTLPESSDEYHTPPDHNPCSQNSSNDGLIPPTKIPVLNRDTEIGKSGGEARIPVGNEGGAKGKIVVDLTNEPDSVVTVEKRRRVVERKTAHQVFVEMPEREKETGNREKRKLPVSMKTQKQKGDCSRHVSFKESLNRVLKMVGEGKKNRGNGNGDEEEEDDDANVDFLATAKIRGLSLPRPRWWPAHGFKD